MRRLAIFAAVMAPALLILSLIPAPAQGQKIRIRIGGGKSVERPAKERDPKPDAKPAEDVVAPPSLKLFEWGVSTSNWDGSPEKAQDADVPSIYYDASEVPISPEPIAQPRPKLPEKPKPKPGPIAKPRKPIIYFACERDVVFDLDIHFTDGRITWMYPKPSRRTDAATAQWDNIRLYTGLHRRKISLPAPARLPVNHWAAFSREGADNCAIVVNKERESFLFYEGERFGLPDTDIFKDGDGNLILHNYTAYPIHDVRVTLPMDGVPRSWMAGTVPAASGDKPGLLRLSDELRVDWGKFSAEGVLAQETQAAGLTASQARVFERAWQELFFVEQGTLSYRREAAALDELMQIKLTLPAGMSSEIKRIGYVLVRNIDLSRQAKLDGLADKAATGDHEAAAELVKSGAAGAGALRRALADASRDLKTRLGLAKLLAEFGAG